MKKILRRFFGTESDLILSLLAWKGFRGRPRRRSPPSFSLTGPRARRRSRQARVRRPGAERPAPEPGPLREALLLLARKRSSIASSGASLLAHAALLFLLVKIPLGGPPPEEELPRIELSLRLPRGGPLETAVSKLEVAPPPPPEAEPPPPAPPPPEPQPPEPEPPEPVVTPSVEKAVAAKEQEAKQVDKDEVGSPGTGEVARLEPEGRPGPPAVLGVGGSPLPGDSDGRGGEGRGDGTGLPSRGGARATRLGMTAATEDAVTRGLAWLAAHQDEDGGWSAAGFGRHCHHFTQCLGKGLGEFDAGVTGLCALAFLGAGQAPGEAGPYGRTLERALASLVSGQRPDGAFGARGEKFLYNHAIASFAICEAYARTRDSRYLRPALAGLRFSAAAQQSGGGWDYSDTPTGRNDLSITGWQAMAFRAAEAGGMPVAEETLRRLCAFLSAASMPGGEGIYADRGMGAGRRGINMTAVALLSRLYLGTPLDDPWVEAAADRLIRTPPEASLTTDWDRHFQSSYYWYSATLCLFHLGGRRWEAWNHFLKREILPLQSRAVHEDGSWPPDPNWLGAMGGRVFTTAMNVLTLEVYYRYPPLHTYEQKGRAAR